MKVLDKSFGKLNSKEFNDKVEHVDYKTVMLLDLKRQFKKEEVKEMVRFIFKDTDISIRYKVDMEEESWLGKEFVAGLTTVIVRTKSKEKSIESIFNSSVIEKDLTDIVSLKGVEFYKVSDLVEVRSKYDRVVYELNIELNHDPAYSKSETHGKWKQDVMLWDGSTDNVTVEGTVRTSLKRLNSDSNVYKLLIDSPYGLDVYRIVETEVDLPKNSLKNYPMNCLYIYESVDSNKNYISRLKCEKTGKVIESTIGGYVGNTCIEELLNV